MAPKTKIEAAPKTSHNRARQQGYPSLSHQMCNLGGPGRQLHRAHRQPHRSRAEQQPRRAGAAVGRTPAAQSQPACSCTELDRKRSELASSRPELAGWRTKLAGRQSRTAAEQNRPATAQPDSGCTELAAAGKEMGWDLKRVTIQRFHNIHKCNLSKT